MFRTIVKASLAPAASAIILAFTAASALARGQAEPTRADSIVADEQRKSGELTKYEGTRAEQVLTRIEETFITGTAIHPFFESALAGGGFTLGAGYRHFVGSYNTIDLRGSITFTGYKRIEAEFLAPRVFKRRGVLSVIGGWREATQVGFYGTGTGTTSVDMEAGNTLDTVITENGRGVVKHYLQDVGSTFGMGANGPHDWEEGWEYLDEGGPTRKRLLTFGFALSPWQTAEYREHDAIGRFEGESFGPLTWKPRSRPQLSSTCGPTMDSGRRAG